MNKRQRKKQIKMNRSYAMDTDTKKQDSKEEMYKNLATEIEQLTASLKEFKSDLKEEQLEKLKDDMKKLKAE